ncbi:sulfurtransferase [Micrococcus flavus]|uniref:Thiosulfate/3-mercaptopyruvate sulfurtransferase n=1 Tax=Micrococcus flavus TaxID=384602 RepID=A0A4Y8X485_9MICC|nr:sulfurtransferase [Micrococcus flavus]MBB4883058.1 thiosulfate/3-mercaptopyruvate sulfurtransferase [Micrococcus flavus]TFI04473.1 sulfurtransferase [Micrococcus flavus]GGK42100.1 sulfurtransferase [Micrococcus flavus]
MQTPGPDTSPRREGSREPVEDPAERAARAAVGPAAVEPDPSGDGPDPAAAEPPSLVAVDVLARWLGLAAGPDADAGQPAPAFDARKDPGRLVLLDVRYSMAGGGSGHEEYLHGHLPGAVFVSLPNQLAGHAGPRQGRHPLPAPDQFAESVRLWGVDDGDTVVVYDDDRGLAAARAWWLLRHAGIRDSVLLDGGLGAWREAGLPLQPGEVIPVPGTARPSWGRMPVVDSAGAEAIAAGGLLLDARAAERYCGEVEPLDPVAGHIPGARSLPTAESVGPDGRLRPVDEIAARFEAVGLTDDVPAAVYCGSGVTAAHQILTLAAAGRHGVALYPGSWSAWIQDPDNPVATGPEPGGR